MKNWAFAGNFFFTRFSQFQLTPRHFKCSSIKTSSKIFAQIRKKLFLNTLRPECFRRKCSFCYVGCKYDNKSLSFFGSTMRNFHIFLEVWNFSLKLFHCTWRPKNSEDQPKFFRSVFKNGWFSWNSLIIFYFQIVSLEAKYAVRKSPHSVFSLKVENNTNIQSSSKSLRYPPNFCSLNRSTAVLKSKYKIFFRNVSKSSKSFKIFTEVCWKISFWQLRGW